MPRKARAALLAACSLLLIMTQGCSDPTSKYETASPEESERLRAEVAGAENASAAEQAAALQAEEAPKGGYLVEGKYVLTIYPLKGIANTVFTLSSQGFEMSGEITGNRVVWFINDNPVSTYEFARFDARAMGARKGDRIQAKAYVGETEVPSEEVVIENSRPVLSNLRLMPETWAQGDQLYIECDPYDLDGDPVSIEYEWTLNDLPAGYSKNISGSVQRGDRFTVRLRPYDGEVYGDAVGIIRSVENVPPQLTLHKEFSFDGDTYIYNTVASDVDGDRLTFGLINAPQGMTMDSSTGQIRWLVPKTFVGKADYIITASDGRGGSAEMQMSFTITEEKKGAKQPPPPQSGQQNK